MVSGSIWSLAALDAKNVFAWSLVIIVIIYLAIIVIVFLLNIVIIKH